MGVRMFLSTPHIGILQVEDWRLRRAGGLRICTSQMDFAKSLLGASSSRSRSPELQSLRRAARSASELLRPGMPPAM